MERLRSEREEWEDEAMRERERRELVEEEMRGLERREREGRKEWERGKDDLEIERQRARNLQDVLGEFQAGQSSTFSSSLSYTFTGASYDEVHWDESDLMRALELTTNPSLPGEQLKTRNCGKPLQNWNLN